MQLLAMVVAGGVIVTGVALWGRAWQRYRCGLPLLPSASPPGAPWGLVDLGLAVLIWLLVNAGAVAVAEGFAGGIGLPSRWTEDALANQFLLLLSSAATLVVCLLVGGMLWFRHRVSGRELGWDPAWLVRDMVLGAKAFAMLAPIVYGMQWLLTQFVESQHPLIDMLERDPRPEFFLAAGVAAVVVAPLAEEFLFRVLLQGWLERLCAHTSRPVDELVLGTRSVTARRGAAPGHDAIAAGTPPPLDSPRESNNPYESPQIRNDDWVETGDPGPIAIEVTNLRSAPILFSSLFFALSHWSHGPDPVPLFVLALGLGYLYQRTGRAVPCIVLHVLLNACSLAALWLTVKE